MVIYALKQILFLYNLKQFTIMSLKKSTTTDIKKYLTDELRTTEARNFKVEILRDADLLERVFLEKMAKKVNATQAEDELIATQITTQKIEGNRPTANEITEAE